MRGRLSKRRRFCGLQRNTPAYAGKTELDGLNCQCLEKHPRVCGEDRVKNAMIPFSVETPPRMRGRPGVFLRFGRTRGNTPAYAGKTDEFHPSALRISKHPRVCGEDSSES